MSGVTVAYIYIYMWMPNSVGRICLPFLFVFFSFPFWFLVYAGASKSRINTEDIRSERTGQTRGKDRGMILVDSRTVKLRGHHNHNFHVVVAEPFLPRAGFVVVIHPKHRILGRLIFEPDGQKQVRQ